MKKLDNLIQDVIAGIAVLFIRIGNANWIQGPTQTATVTLRSTGSFFGRTWWKFLLGAIVLVILWVLFLVGSAFVSWVKVGMQQSAATQAVQATQTMQANQTMQIQQAILYATQTEMARPTGIPTPTATPISVWRKAKAYGTSWEIFVPPGGVTCLHGVKFYVQDDSLVIDDNGKLNSIKSSNSWFTDTKGNPSKWAAYDPLGWGVTYLDSANNSGQSNQILNQTGWVIDNKGDCVAHP